MEFMKIRCCFHEAEHGRPVGRSNFTVTFLEFVKVYILQSTYMSEALATPFGLHIHMQYDKFAWDR